MSHPNRYLNISNNELEGGLPSLPTALVSVDISSNRLGGSLPADMGAYTNLVDLQVGVCVIVCYLRVQLAVQFCCFVLCCSVLQACAAVTYCDARAPHPRCSFPHMQPDNNTCQHNQTPCHTQHQAYYNVLEGELPRKLPPNMIQLAVTGNRLTGSVPPLPRGMKYLSLAENALEGPLPNGPGAAQLWFVSIK